MIVMGCAMLNRTLLVMFKSKKALETSAMASWMALTTVSLDEIMSADAKSSAISTEHLPHGILDKGGIVYRFARRNVLPPFRAQCTDTEGRCDWTKCCCNHGKCR